MKDSTELDADSADRSAVEALFKGLQAYLREEAQRTLPVLLPKKNGTGHFREDSLERLYFDRMNAGTIPFGSVALVLPTKGGQGS